MLKYFLGESVICLNTFFHFKIHLAFLSSGILKISWKRVFTYVSKNGKAFCYTGKVQAQSKLQLNGEST